MSMCYNFVLFFWGGGRDGEDDHTISHHSGYTHTQLLDILNCARSYLNYATTTHASNDTYVSRSKPFSSLTHFSTRYFIVRSYGQQWQCDLN